MNDDEKTDEPKVVLLHETVAQSLLRDAGTFCMLVACMGVGWFLDSSAMQWAGFIMFFLFIFGRVMGTAKNNQKTPQAAADWLKEKFGVVASGH